MPLQPSYMDERSDEEGVDNPSTIDENIVSIVSTASTDSDEFNFGLY